MKRLIFVFAAVSAILIAGAVPQQSSLAQQATPAATAAAPKSDPLGGATTFAKADKPTTINLVLDWTPNTNHLGFYVAQAKGYYKEANLTVEIQQPGDVQVEKLVSLGKAQFGVSYQEQTTYSRADGVPIVSVAALIQHNTSGFAALKSKHVLKGPADLAGLTYGSFGSPIEKPILEALMKCVGSSADKITFVDIGFSDPLPLMDKNRIDFVWSFYAWDGIHAEILQLPLNFVMLKDYTNCVPDYYTPILITNGDLLKNQPNVVKAFVQATARGYADAIKNPAEAADILLKAAPDLEPKQVKQSADWLAAQFQADAPRWGQQKAEVWQAFSDFMVKNGALKKGIDPQAAFTNDFLPGK